MRIFRYQFGKQVAELKAGVEQGGHQRTPLWAGARCAGAGRGARFTEIFSLFDPSTDGTHARSGPRAGGMRRKTACRPRLRLKGDVSVAGLGRDGVRSSAVVSVAPSVCASAPGESGRGPGSGAPSVGEPRLGGVGGRESAAADRVTVSPAPGSVVIPAPCSQPPSTMTRLAALLGRRRPWPGSPQLLRPWSSPGWAARTGGTNNH